MVTADSDSTQVKMGQLRELLPHIRELLQGRGASVLKEAHFKEIAENLLPLLPEGRTLDAARLKSFFLKQELLEKVRLQLNGKGNIRYLLPNASDFDVAQSLHDHGYFSHYSAMLLNNLTEQIPKTIYFNIELPPLPRPNPESLTQQAITRAFAAKQRDSKNRTDFREHTIVLVRGMHSNNLGVGFLEEQRVLCTNLERTLIDITVRPAYSGGIDQVLEAYRRASNKISTNTMLAYVRKLGYVYPYHQAIGFLLEYSGAYPKDAIARFEQLPRKFDFYLAHGEKEIEYNEKWKLFVPRFLYS